MTSQHSVVLTTAASRENARDIAMKLLSERLAACVQFLPIESLYTWKGKIVDDNEVLLLIKTRDDCYAEIERTILSLHHYEVPEIVTFAVTNGLAAYLNWIDEVTQTNSMDATTVET